MVALAEAPAASTALATVAPTAGVRYPLASVTYGAEEIAAVVETLESGRTTCGPRVAAFEAAFADYLGVPHAVMVNSGSSAALLVACGLGPAEPGDEILVPAVTWPTQVWACVLAGYRVRLVDVDPATLQMDAEDLERKATRHSRAVFAVHVLGATGNLRRLRQVADRNGLSLLQDCCEALGARYDGRSAGAIGRGSAFSFFFSHVLTTMEGGMVTTSSAEDAARYRLWRNHGWQPRPGAHFTFPTWGMNLRPTEIQGAFGLVQLGRLNGFLAARARNAARLAAGTTGAYDTLEGMALVPDCEPALHAFPLLVAAHAPFTRDALCAYLDAHGIETRPIIAGNIARQPAVAHDARIETGPLPGADVVHERGFYIGLASHDDEAGTTYVSDTIAAFMRTAQHVGAAA